MSKVVDSNCFYTVESVCSSSNFSRYFDQPSLNDTTDKKSRRAMHTNKAVKRGLAKT